MEQTPNESIALLIDADNAPAGKIEFIFSELASHGKVNIRRAYGNWKKQGLSGWEKVLHDHAIQPSQHFDLIKGKNASDIGLVIEAMDILYTKSVDTFCLVSSDCDFTPLVLRLRADGKQVIGFGGQKTPEPFINGCTKFLYLDEVEKSPSTPDKKKAPAKPFKASAKLIYTLRSAVQATEDEDGWAPLGPVGAHISNQGPFDHRTYGFSKLSGLFKAIDQFEVEELQNGNRLAVRVRFKGPAKPDKARARKS